MQEDPSPEDRQQDYLDVFQTAAGQRVLADLMSRFSYARLSTIPQDFNPHHAAFNEGKRCVMVHIYRTMTSPAVAEDPSPETPETPVAEENPFA